MRAVNKDSVIEALERKKKSIDKTYAMDEGWIAALDWAIKKVKDLPIVLFCPADELRHFIDILEQEKKRLPKFSHEYLEKEWAIINCEEMLKYAK